MSRSLKSRHVPRYPWEKLSDEQLLSLRFCDLKLSLRNTRVEAAVERLYGELSSAD